MSELSSALMTPREGFFCCKWTPCSCSVFCYCCHLNLWSLPSGYQLQPSRGLTYTHAETHCFLLWQVLNGRVKEISSLFIGWPGWVRFSTWSTTAALELYSLWDSISAALSALLWPLQPLCQTPPLPKPSCVSSRTSHAISPPLLVHVNAKAEQIWRLCCIYNIK